MRIVHKRTGAEADGRDDFAERRSDRWCPVSGTPSTSDRDETESLTKADLVATDES